MGTQLLDAHAVQQHAHDHSWSLKSLKVRTTRPRLTIREAGASNIRYFTPAMLSLGHIAAAILNFCCGPRFVCSDTVYSDSRHNLKLSEKLHHISRINFYLCSLVILGGICCRAAVLNVIGTWVTPNSMLHPHQQ